MASIVSDILSFPVQKTIVKRVKKTIPQVEMSHRKERLENMRNVFEVQKEHELSLKGTSVLLVDDVFTTGATMRSAAEVIKRAGAKTVWGLTIAQ
jgi:predicted amidophosphoribosyltransferase